MKIATTTSDFSLYTSDALTASKYIKKAGFKYIDYSFGADFGQKIGFFSNDYDGWLKKIRKYMEKSSVKYVQAHSPMGRPIVKDDEQQALIEGTKLCVKACADLGIENLVVHSGYKEGNAKAETYEQNREFYLDLLKYAENFGVNILTENFNKMFDPNIFWIDNATDLLELIKYVDHPLFHACYDIGHANLQDMPQHEELAILGSHVKAIHVQDNLGDDDFHLAPFFGTTNFDSVMKGLKDIDFKGYFTFEACSIPVSGYRRRKFEGSELLLNAPLSVKLKTEALIYEIGKAILEAYDCFEE